jgi:hypothetical protein
VTIHIAFTDPSALQERCASTFVHLMRDEPGYDAHALIPVPDWQPVSAEEVKSLSGDGLAADGARVEIVRLGHGAPHHGSTPEQICGYDPFAGCWPSSFLGFVDNVAGQGTTTVDRATGTRLGVHLDNFDKLPTARCAESRRRLAANLGPGSRYLVLATEDIEQISSAMGATIRHPHTNDVRRYVREGHPLRCIRIRLDPGEGYIAPTELIPHDGSTWGMLAPSRIAFWLGHWPAGTLRTLI